MLKIEEHEVIQDYLSKVCARVRAKKLHPEICEELSGHIEERADTSRNEQRYSY